MPIKYLQPDELKRIIDAAKDSKRNYAMMVVSYHHVLRSAELCDLTLADFDEGNRRLVIVPKKKRQKKPAPFYEAFCPANGCAPSDLTVLHAWLKERATLPYAGESDALFISQKGTAIWPTTWSHIFHDYAVAAGIHEDWQHSHVLRHTGIMTAVKGGMPLHLVRQMSRHANFASLIPYLEDSQDVVDFAKFKAFSKF